MILCEVNKNSLKVRTSELLTAGSREVNEVEFRFNSAWDGVTKTAVFRTEKKTVSVLLDGDKTQLPWEVLADAGEVVAVGVYGVSGETLVLPTVWGIIGKVVDAAKLGDEEKEPTPDVYQQILDKLNSMSWDTLENKPFTSIGSGLKVEDGTLTATAQGGADITITDTAEVGEVLTVEEVDSEGKPTKWKTEKPTEQKQADWEQADTIDASYIKNKPTIPDAAQIDTTLTKSGQAADAKSVGDALAGKQAAGDYITEESDPTVPTWAKQATKPTYTASEVGAVATVQGTDNSGKYLGVGTDGNVTTVDAPSGGGEQVQADWYEFDTTSAAYVKNKPFSDVLKNVTGRYYANYYSQGEMWVTTGRLNASSTEFILMIADDVYNVNNNIDTILAKYDLSGTWNSTYKEYFITGTTENLKKIKKIYQIESSTAIPWRYLPTDYVADGRAIFTASPITSTANYSECGFVAGDHNRLYAPNPIKIFSTFDFNANALATNSVFANLNPSTEICYTTGVGTASEALGLTADDFPVMSYCISSVYVGERPQRTFYIETVTNKRYKATYLRGTTTWTSVVSLNSDSSGTETALIAFGYNGEDTYYYDLLNGAIVDESTLKTTLGESPWKIWFMTSDGRLLPLTTRDYENDKLYFADYANCTWHVISNIGTDSDVTYTPTCSPEPMATNTVVLNSTTADSTKKFMLTVDDSGTISATEITV